MQLANVSGILVEKTSIVSRLLLREVKVDLFLPKSIENPSSMSLLLLNDGQHMEEMGFASILEQLYAERAIGPLLCAAIHAGHDRKREYGVAAQPDYKGRGDLAGLYHSFVLKELLPFLHRSYSIPSFREKAFAGFSLGGLSAIDMVWNHPGEFNKAGVFSGSLWWRSKGQEELDYDDHKHRIMHEAVKQGQYKPGLKFYFQCGNMDETRDRNSNGIIDSIDDTLDLVKELEIKGYVRGKDILYTEIKDGHHDIPTWARAMPEFLQWGWGDPKG